MRLDTGQRLPRLFFTDAGLAEPRTVTADRAVSPALTQSTDEIGIRSTSPRRLE
jgi:hypothetical protein